MARRKKLPHQEAPCEHELAVAHEHAAGEAMSDTCGEVFRDPMGKPFEWLSGPDKGMYIICGKEPNHDGEQHGTDDGIYKWDAD